MTTAAIPLTETPSPATAAEVADVVRRAGESGTPVRVSLEKLNRVIDYPADDMTITVEAGVTVAELNRRLAEKRQWLPIDVARPEQTTVGEAIDMNAAGPRRFGYGTIRDYLLGFSAVDGTGTIFFGGGRVVKNAAGYNMCRLMAGSFGTLGIITQATFMVRPMPETSAMLACEVHDFELAETLLAALVHLPAQPISVELEAGHFAEENPLCGAINRKNAARLCVGFEGAAVEVAWILDRTAKEWKSLGMTQPMITPRLVDDRYWRWSAGFAADETIFVLPSELVCTVSELRRDSPQCAIQAHAGDGVIRIKRLAAELAPQNVPLARKTLAEPVAHGVSNNAAVRISHAIKERFDPKNILNPGYLFD